MAFATACLIALGIIVIGSVAVSMYQIYTSDSQIKSAIQMAKNDNRMIEFNISNGSKGAFNLSSTSKFEMVNKNYNITRVVVYPKNYKTEYFRDYKSGNIILPYNVNTLLN